MPLRPGARACELELRLPAREWGRLQAEAERQKVNLERLLEHATIRFMADLDAGRVTEQLASSLGLRLRPPDR